VVGGQRCGRSALHVPGGGGGLPAHILVYVAAKATYIRLLYSFASWQNRFFWGGVSALAP